MLLFELIKSLTKSEKRYFKLFTTINSDDKKYISLFDIIDSMKQFNSKFVKETFKHDNLSESKYYLKNAILKSLNSYHNTLNINTKIAYQLQSVEILYQKGLLALSQNILDKAFNLARKNESFLWMLTILSWQDQINLSKNISFSDYNLLLKKLQKKSEKIIKLYIEYNKMMYTARKLSYYVRSVRYIRTSKSRRELGNTLNKINISMLKSNASKMLAYKSNATICFMKSDSKGFQKELINNLHFMELNRVVGVRYLNAHVDICLAFIDDKKYDLAKKYFIRLKTIYNNPKGTLTVKEKASIYMHIVSIQLEIEVLAIRDYSAGKILLEDEIINGVEKIKSIVPNQDLLAIYFIYAIIYFGLKNYHRSLSWLERVVEIKENIIEYIQGVARILILIIYYELENIILLESIILSTNRFLSKNKRLYLYEKIILKFIKKAISINKNNISDLNTLKKELEQISLDPIGKGLLEIFDIRAWVDSKIQNCDYVTVLKNKDSTR